MSSLATGTLRVLLVLIFLLSLIGQIWVVPQIAAGSALTYPELGSLAGPYASAIILGIACVQVALVAVWVLLRMVRRGAIFSQKSLFWVNLIIGAGVVATVLAVAVGVHLVVWVDGGPVILFILGAAIAGAVVVLFMIVMRGLLLNATRLETELAEVV